jgi:predicted phosphodiesterase
MQPLKQEVMTKIWVLSDLHGEFKPKDQALTPPDKADVAIFAGDIHKVRHAVSYARALVGDLPLILVAGNHEHYNSHLTVAQGIELLSSHAKEDREQNGNKTFALENDAITLNLCGEPITFIGATLWTDFLLFRDYKQSIAIAKERMHDFHVIIGTKIPYRPLHPSDTVVWHKQSRAFIRGKLGTERRHKTVVVTHHAPSIRSVATQYWQDGLTPAFVSDCSDLVKLDADLWVHGHTHDSFDYTIGRTRVVCNPRGYPVSVGQCGFENLAFDPRFLVEI